MRIARQLAGLSALGRGLAPGPTWMAWVACAAIAGASAGCRDSSANSGQSAAAASAIPVEEVVLAGIDTSAMTPRERREWSSVVTTLLAPCPTVPVSVAQCVREQRACGPCAIAAKWMAKAVREGASEDQIQRAYKERFDPSTAKVIPVDGSPTRGPDDAPVTIIEFADFECPHCAGAVPLLDAVLAAHPGKVRLVYKSYTLPFHTRGEPAAKAALAAAAQGKFWEMEHLLFERQLHLEDADLERYAKMVGLDLARWKADQESRAVTDEIQRDRALGEQLKLKGTPTLYINGRELALEQDESLEGVVAAELGVPAVVSPPAPGGSLPPPGRSP